MNQRMLAIKTMAKAKFKSFEQLDLEVKTITAKYNMSQDDANELCIIMGAMLSKKLPAMIKDKKKLEEEYNKLNEDEKNELNSRQS